MLGDFLRLSPELNQWLAQQLRPYGIKPRTIWIGDQQAKGYAEEDFHEAFRRYIPAQNWTSSMPKRKSPSNKTATKPRPRRARIHLPNSCPLSEFHLKTPTRV